MALANGTKLNFVATAYGPPWDAVQGTGVTSTGVDLTGGQQKLVVAVDPGVVPYGTKLQFNPNPFGNTQLVFTASDTGGAIKGHRLDFFIASGRQAQNGWGVKNTTGTVTGTGSPTDVAVLGGPGSTAPGAGGTAGLGGTGSTSNASSGSPFAVGDTSNPNEDYFTAINRLAQSAQWYSFSDGETLYVADGTLLMQQTPAAVINLNDADVLQAELTYDNTAYSYVSQHKKRTHIQRKATLAKVTSPVEVTLQFICPPDAIRAGDVIYLLGAGPGDGLWLVGEARRSVFLVYTELTLVPALSPILAAAGVNQAAGGSSGTKGGMGGYVNPVGKWTPSRIDQGVDGTLTGPYVAPGNSTIVIANKNDAGWAGGGYVAGKFLAGSLTGKLWYVAEGIVPSCKQNDNVSAGQPVANLVPNPYNGTTGNIETGWADPGNPGRPLAQSLPGYGGDVSPQAIAAGSSFNRFLKALGAATGSTSHSAGGVTLPGGYP